MSKRGLPATLKMRHDEHYVDALTSSAGAPIGRLVAIEQIEPNPDQPRQVMGDLSELMASISEKGVIEPLVVRHRVANQHRRIHHPDQIGSREVPHGFFHRRHVHGPGRRIVDRPFQQILANKVRRRGSEDEFLEDLAKTFAIQTFGGRRYAQHAGVGKPPQNVPKDGAAAW